MATKRVEVPANAYGYRAPKWTNQIKNMPEDNCSDYEKFDLWIVDDVDRGPNVQGGAGSPGAVQHESLCNAVHDLFSNVFTDCTVHSLRMQPGEREVDFTQRIDAILEQYTSYDLVAFYYHGKAGEKGDEYTWRFRGPGPRHINAYDFIRQVNRSDTDCYLILDCFIPTNFPKKWMRKKAMTEFSIAGHQMRDDHGRPVNGAGNFTESLCRAVRDIADNPRGDARQSIHHIMGRDKAICSRPMRLWTARPNRRKRNTVWRFFVDVDRFKENGRFHLRKCRITGRRKGDGEFDNDSDSGGDYGGSDDGDEIGNGNGGHGDDDDGDDDGGRGRPDGRRGGPPGDNDDDGDDDDDDPGPDPGGADKTSPRLGGQSIKRQHSSTPSSQGRSIKRSRSSSPVIDGFDGFDGFRRPKGESLVKREGSASPEVEIISSRAITSYIDLTSDGDIIDLTQEDDPEESLFIPLG